MKVKAIKQGFFGGARRNPGAVFEMAGATVKAGEVIGKNGKPVSWVTSANGEGLSSPKARGAVVSDPARTTGSKSPDELDESEEQ